jgi:hypothetical protein
MTDKPVTTYIVSVFEKPHWRTVLTTEDMAKALTKAKLGTRPNRLLARYDRLDQGKIDNSCKDQADRHCDNYGIAQALCSPPNVSEIILICDQVKDRAVTGDRIMIVVCKSGCGVIDVWFK